MKKIKYSVLFLLVCLLLSSFPCTGVKAAETLSSGDSLPAADDYSLVTLDESAEIMPLSVEFGSTAEYDIPGANYTYSVLPSMSDGISYIEIPLQTLSIEKDNTAAALFSLNSTFSVTSQDPSKLIINSYFPFIMYNGVKYRFNYSSRWFNFDIDSVGSDQVLFGVDVYYSSIYNPDLYGSYSGSLTPSDTTDYSSYYDITLTPDSDDGTRDTVAGIVSTMSSGTFKVYYRGGLISKIDNANSHLSAIKGFLQDVIAGISGLGTTLQETIVAQTSRVISRINTFMENFDSWQSTINTSITTFASNVDSYFRSLITRVDNFRTEFDTWQNTIYTHLTNFSDMVSGKFNSLMSRVERVQSEIVTQFTVLFAKMDEQQDELINGYDPVTGDDANDEFENTIDDLAGTEGNLFEISHSDFKFEESDLLSDTGLLAAASFVGNYMQGIFEASGIFGRIAIVGLILLVFTRLIGYQNFSSGGG